MSRSERRIRNNKIRRRRERRKNIFLAALTICLVFTLSFTVSGFLSNAKTDSNDISIKYYKSIMVEHGDTLWSIAAEHVNGTGATADLVNEIKELNDLHGDGITAGSYLVVPYFSNDFITSQELCAADI